MIHGSSVPTGVLDARLHACATSPTDRKGASTQDVLQRAVRENIERHGRAELIDWILEAELPRYADALERLSR